MRLSFGKQSVRRNDVGKEGNIRWGGEPSGTMQMTVTPRDWLSNKIESPWVPGAESSYQTWSTYFWNLTWAKKISILFKFQYPDSPLHEPGPFI